MDSLKTIRLDGDNVQARREFEAYLKELGVNWEDDEDEEN